MPVLHTLPVDKNLQKKNFNDNIKLSLEQQFQMRGNKIQITNNCNDTQNATKFKVIA